MEKDTGKVLWENLSKIRLIDDNLKFRYKPLANIRE
jgi:hypothetical protein